MAAGSEGVVGAWYLEEKSLFLEVWGEVTRRRDCSDDYLNFGKKSLSGWKVMKPHSEIMKIKRINAKVKMVFTVTIRIQD